MLTVFGIKSCDTCRKARKYFAENDIEFRFHDVRDDGLDALLNCVSDHRVLVTRTEILERVRDGGGVQAIVDGDLGVNHLKVGRSCISHDFED